MSRVLMVKYLPERVRQARLEMGWTKRDLAARLGVTERAVYNWEAGKASAIRLLNLRALAALTGRSVDWFTGE